VVAIALPPPLLQPQPLFHQLDAGTTLRRLYDPSRFGATGVSFRHFGPLSRFDHQREPYPRTSNDADRGILYAARTLSGCLVEVFGDSKVILVGSWEVAILTATRNLNLLDLRGTGAIKAGTVAAVCKDSNRQISQTWSRYFYDNVFIYGEIDGLVFGNAHNDEDAFAFYERSVNDFQCAISDICPLRESALRMEVECIARDSRMYVQPY